MMFAVVDDLLVRTHNHFRFTYMSDIFAECVGRKVDRHSVKMRPFGIAQLHMLFQHPGTRCHCQGGRFPAMIVAGIVGLKFFSSDSDSVKRAEAASQS